MSIKSIWNPAMYHGKRKRRTFFEGWYYKVVDVKQQHAYAFIPGIALGVNSHAFIQVVDGNNNHVNYHTYPIEGFIASSHSFEVQLAGNKFNSESLVLDIEEKAQTIKGALYFTEQKNWPKSFFSPGAMGWFSFVPFMECYHGIISLDHRIEGHLNVDGKDLDFTGGRGYLEKDWGRSFPQGWVWMQSNHFECVGTSFTASIAVVPWMRRHFTGFIIGLWHKGHLYRFTTYLNAKITEFEVSNNRVRFSVQQGQYKLNLQGEMREGVNLPSPVQGAMVGRVKESLTSSLEVSLYHREKLIYSDIGQSAGLELGGDVTFLKQSFGR